MHSSIRSRADGKGELRGGQLMSEEDHHSPSGASPQTEIPLVRLQHEPVNEGARTRDFDPRN